MRKRRDRSIPCVASKIAKRNEVRSEGSKKTRTPAFGMPSYLPQVSLTEDTESIGRHKQFMQDESKKRNPDRRKIDTCMAVTFDDRRKLIITDNVNLATLKEEYPCLWDSQQVKYNS
jgi:hypothetical protein